MFQNRTPGIKARSIFRIVAIATLVSAFAQTTLGGVVRVTGSGLGCPDWPLCHGRLIPPFDVATMIEYTHRLSGALLGILIIGILALALVFYRSDRRIVAASLAGLVMVITAGALGGATVLTELAWWFRTLHLGIAQVVVALSAFLIVAAWRTGGSDGARRGGSARTRGSLEYLLPASVAGVLLLILYGSYMVGYGAGSSCASWPLCRGSLFPEGEAYAVHMAHRYIAGLIGVLVMVTAWRAWTFRAHSPALAWSGIALAAVFMAQVLVGAATVWTGFSLEMRAAHLSVSTLVWMALVFAASLYYTSPSARANQPGHGRRHLSSELEGVAP